MYLISPYKKQFKANLHCHSVISDGKLTPEQLKNAYKENGYSVLAITDHEVPCSHQEISDSEFLMLTGYETYIRPNPDCRYDKYNYDQDKIKNTATLYIAEGESFNKLIDEREW